MLLFFILILIFLYFYNMYYKHIGFSALLIFFISTVCLSLFSFECIYREIDYFLSDELYYINFALDKVPYHVDRFLWFFINDLILNHDISLNNFALKIINIPIAACLLIVLWLIFRDKRVFWIPIILPYFALIATKNIRDIPIFLFTALTSFLFHHPKPIYVVFGLISLTMLFLLRPFAAGVLFIILLIQISFFTIKPIYRFKISKKHLIKVFLIFIICLSILPITLPSFKTLTARYYDWYIYTTGEGRSMMERNRVQSDPLYASGSKTRDFLVAGIRYAVTPIPTSLIKRALEGGSSWGIVDDLIRVINQIGYYLMILFLIINAQYIHTVFLKLAPSGKAIIMSLLTYWPIYSWHLYGVTHQRLKLPLQIVVFLIAMGVLEYKKNYRMSFMKS